MNNLDELEKLASLKKKKIIIEAEFQEQKKRLLKIEAKSQTTYCILALFTGALGIHNFYIGRWKRGLAQLLISLSLIFPGVLFVSVWNIFNIFQITTDGKGKEIIKNDTSKYVCGIIGILLIVIEFILANTKGCEDWNIWCEVEW